MTRKDYIAIAKIIKASGDAATFDEHTHDPGASCDYCDGQTSERTYIAKELAQLFASENAAFDYDRFWVACGLR